MMVSLGDMYEGDSYAILFSVLANMESLFGGVKSCFFSLYVGKMWGRSLGSIGIKKGLKHELGS